VAAPEDRVNAARGGARPTGLCGRRGAARGVKPAFCPTAIGTGRGGTVRRRPAPGVRHPGRVPGSTGPQASHPEAPAARWAPEHVRGDGSGLWAREAHCTIFCTMFTWLTSKRRPVRIRISNKILILHNNIDTQRCRDSMVLEKPATLLTFPTAIAPAGLPIREYDPPPDSTAHAQALRMPLALSQYLLRRKRYPSPLIPYRASLLPLLVGEREGGAKRRKGEGRVF